jgi:hypothetical protein
METEAEAETAVTVTVRTMVTVRMMKNSKTVKIVREAVDNRNGR